MERRSKIKWSMYSTCTVEVCNICMIWSACNRPSLKRNENKEMLQSPYAVIHELCLPKAKLSFVMLLS